MSGFSPAEHSPSVTLMKEASSAVIGRTVSHYKVIDKIGEGGMGSVWKAEDTSLGRLVALKTLSSHLAQNEEARERFIREAQAASALNHPNITTVYELVEAEDAHLICMEHVEGKTVRDMLESGRVSIKKAIDVILQAAEALEAAHRKGILHRDIKSANIMVTLEGRVKVMDFGLAHLGERSQLTRTGTLLGTLAYTSPEQIAGKPYDARSEIWSLGVVLYELLAGRLPFQASNEAELIFGIINNEPPVLGEVREDSDMLVESVVARMLEKDPTLRYQSMGELTNDLAALRKGLETGTTSVIRALEQAKRVRRRILVTRLAVGVAVASTILLAATQLTWRPTTPDLEKPRVLVNLFENNTGDVNLDRFTETLTRQVTDRLHTEGSATELISVIPLDEARPYFPDTGNGRRRTGRGSPVRRLARQTRAPIVITGSLSQVSSAVSLDMTIHDIQTGETITFPIAPRGQIEALDQLAEQTGDRLMGALSAHLDPLMRFCVADITPPPSYRAYHTLHEALVTYFSYMKLSMREVDPWPAFMEAVQSDSTWLAPVIWALDYLQSVNTTGSDSLKQLVESRRNSLLNTLDRQQAALNPVESQHLDYLRLPDARINDHERYEIARSIAERKPESIWSYRAGKLAIRLYRLPQADDHFQAVFKNPALLEDIDIWLWSWEYLAVLWVQDKYDRALTFCESIPVETSQDDLNLTSMKLMTMQAMIYAGRIDDFWATYEEKKPLILQTWTHLMIIWPEFLVPFQKVDRQEDVDRILAEAEGWFAAQPEREQGLLGLRCLRAQTYFFAGEWDKARELYEVLARDVARAVEEGTLPGNREEAYAFSIYVFGGYTGVLRDLACSAAHSGMDSIAERAETLLTEWCARVNDPCTYAHAKIAAARGEKDRALELLSQVLSDRGWYMINAQVGYDWFYFRDLDDEEEFKAIFQPRIY